MHLFKDNAGRSWTIAINVTAVERCRARVEVDLYGLLDNKFEGLGKLTGDPVKLFHVIYCLCQEDADKLGVSPEDFGRAMGGDSLFQAQEAFVDELTDFFGDPRVRAGLKKVMEASHKLTDRLIEHAMSKIDEIDLDSEVEKLIASFGNSRA